VEHSAIMDRFLKRQAPKPACPDLTPEEIARRNAADAAAKEQREQDFKKKLKLEADMILARTKWHLSDAELPPSNWGRPSEERAWCLFLIRWLRVFLSNGGSVDSLPKPPGSSAGRPDKPHDFAMAQHYVSEKREMEFGDKCYTWLNTAFARPYSHAGTVCTYMFLEA
jgi:hypothetical protein